MVVHTMVVYNGGAYNGGAYNGGAYNGAYNDHSLVNLVAYIYKTLVTHHCLP